MIVVGYILAISGCIAALIGDVLMLKLAYRRGVGWFLGCLVLAPLFWLALLVLHFKSAAKPFALAVVGLIAAGIGGMIAGIEFT